MKLLPAISSVRTGALRAVRGEELVRAAPTLAKLGARALWRAAELTVSGAVRVGSVAVGGVVSGRSVGVIVDDVASEARRIVLRALGESPEPVRPGRPIDARVVDEARPAPLRTLGEQVSDLLDMSNDVTVREQSHPAYRRVVEELAPDEARILRLFAEHGPQASVDVRTRRPLGVGSELVARGITMVGRLAGCSDLDEVPAYLDNLYRLGLILFSSEPLDNLAAYQVLEVQPEVTDAISRVGRGTTVRRSIELTAFGRNFCASCGLGPPGGQPVARSGA